MSFRPIDTITMAPKSWDASMKQVASQHKEVSTHDQLAYEYGKELKRQSEQPIKATKTENSEYRYDSNREGSNGQYEYFQKKRKKEKNVEPEKTNRSEGHIIDLRI